MRRYRRRWKKHALALNFVGDVTFMFMVMVMVMVGVDCQAHSSKARGRGAAPRSERTTAVILLVYYLLPTNLTLSTHRRTNHQPPHSDPHARAMKRILPLTLLCAALASADDLVTTNRIKVQLFAAPAFVSEVSVDAYHNQCLSLDNNLCVQACPVLPLEHG